MKIRKTGIGNFLITKKFMWSFCLEFKAADCWIGVFWKRLPVGVMDRMDYWICIVPCVPIHVWRIRR
jgi:hypothetical protein